MSLFLPKIPVKILLLPFLLLFVHAQQGYSQAKFSAIYNDRKIGYEDVIEIQFKIENADYIESFTPPDFKNFTIISGPNQERGMRSINGKIDEYVSLGFVLKPRGPGTWKIGTATTVADGKILKTQPVTIEVSKKPSLAPSNPGGHSPFSGFGFSPPEPVRKPVEDFLLKPGENVEEKIQKNLLVKLDVSKTTCFIGEPVTAAFKVYTRLRSKTTVTGAPSFNGFSVSELKYSNEPTTESIDGRPYNVYTLRKVQLYPMRTGDIILDPVISDNIVTFLKPGYSRQHPADLFSRLFEGFAQDMAPEDAVVEKSVTLESKPITIHVKELPKNGQPANFKGAVGNFSLEAQLDKQEFTTDGTGNLIITLSGEGNLQLLNAPEINWPEGLEGYDPKIEEQIDNSSVPLSGRKIFTYPFSAYKAGEYLLDSLQFSFFDPQTASYHTVKTQPVQVTILPGKNKMIPLQAVQDGSSTIQKYSYEIILLVLGLIFAVFLIVRRKNKMNKIERDLKKEIALDHIKATKTQEEFKIPENVLVPLHEKLKAGDAPAFYQELNHILKKYLSEKLQIPAEDISRKTINEEMDRHNIGLNTSLILNSLLEEIELNLYSVSGKQELQNSFEKVSEVISLLNKQCGKIKGSSNL